MIAISNPNSAAVQNAPRRIVYICDWLPPDYGAVGQYSELFARQMAEAGADVVLGGLTSSVTSDRLETIGKGSLRIIKLAARSYEKSRFLRRIVWTAQTNTRLLARLWNHMRRADAVLFTGSPPLMLHWIAPANLVLRKQLIYRITDFHPECLMAESKSPPLALRMLYRLTLFWRRRIDEFEVLGDDQRARLAGVGIRPERIRLKRDPSPVAIPEGTLPLPRPVEMAGKLVLLYSGNWGVAHDVDTFIEAYRRHHAEGSGRFVLWLNAVGSKAGVAEAAIRAHGLPVVRSTPVPLEQLASLLVTPDVHLVTLSDPFVGFVLPSKIYGCIASGRAILYVGSDRSDVHLLCRQQTVADYERVDVGDVEGCFAALEKLASMLSRGDKVSNHRTSAGK